MKSLPAFFAALLLVAAGAEVRGGLELGLSHRIENLGTRETTTREVDGLAITFPADEADVIELLRPAIAKYRTQRQAAAREEAAGIARAFSDEDMRAKYRKQIPRLLALESTSGRSFEASYEAAVSEIEQFSRQWEKWSGDLRSLHCWNRVTGQPFKKGERVIFPEISYEPDRRAGDTKFAILPPFANQHVGIEFLRPPTGIKVDASAVGAFRLDLPLYYSPGVSAEDLAADQRKLFEQLPGILRAQILKVAPTIETYLVESLLQSEIKTGYFTAAASETPGGAMLIKALARCYLMVFNKAGVTMTSEEESQMLREILYFDVPADPASGWAFLRALEALDPFSKSANDALPESDYLAIAGSRLAAMTLIKLAQLGDDNGRPILQKLCAAKRVPTGGFASVAGFSDAVKALYPDTFQENFLAARANLVAVVRAKLAADTPQPVIIPKVEPLPDRETQVFDGVSITHPAALRDAVTRLGPELAALVKKARATMAERFGEPLVAPVPVTDAILESIRSQGIEVTRESADMFSQQAAILANGGQFLRRVFEGATLQVWFRDDLVALLKEGREVPGFSYDPARDQGVFSFSMKGSRVVKADETVSLEALKESFASQPTPIFPIILKDRSLADMQVDAQVTRIRQQNSQAVEVLKAAGTITPAQLGIAGDELSKSGLLTPAQALFYSVHEVVEASLITHVIAIADRRWFCDGVANLMAIRACDQQFGATGENAGRRIFESLFDPATLGKRAPEIDLLGWRAVEDEGSAPRIDETLSSAHYYVATRVLLSATDGKADDFLKSWIAEIRKTPWNRANAATLLAAYDKLTGESLREIMEKSVVAH